MQDLLLTMRLNQLRQLANKPLEWTGLHQHPAIAIDSLPATLGQRWANRRRAIAKSHRPVALL